MIKVQIERKICVASKFENTNATMSVSHNHVVLAQAIHDLTDAERTKVLFYLRHFEEMPAEDIAKAELPIVCVQVSETVAFSLKVFSEIEAMLAEVSDDAKTFMTQQLGSPNLRKLWRNDTPRIFLVFVEVETRTLISSSTIVLHTLYELLTSAKSRLQFQQTNRAIVALKKASKNDATLMQQWMDVAGGSNDVTVVYVRLELNEARLVPLRSFLDGMWAEFGSASIHAVEQRERDQWSKGLVNIYLPSEHVMFRVSQKLMSETLSNAEIETNFEFI